MRRSTIISFLVAAVLAVVAVVAASFYLDSELRSREAAANVPTEPKNVVSVVVAAKPLRFGERITSSKVKLIEWPGDSVPNGAFQDVEVIVGKADDESDARFVLTGIEEDEPVLSSKITVPGQRAKLSTTLSSGMKAISIRVNDVAGVAGFVLPGDRVDVMLTRGGRDSAFIDVLLQGVKVLAIDQVADDRKDQPSIARTVTFEVTTQEAQKLTLAATAGTLSLALRNISSSETEKLRRVTIGDLSRPEVSDSLEKEVKSVDERIDEVAETLRSEVQQALRLRDEKEVEAEPKISSEPEFSFVYVVKNGNRQEYRFEAK